MSLPEPGDAGPDLGHDHALVSESATKIDWPERHLLLHLHGDGSRGSHRTYTVGIEGYRSIVLLPGTATQQTVRDVGFNQVINFSVDGTPVAAHPVRWRRPTATRAISLCRRSGTIRQNVQYCLLCHNPTQTDAALRPAAQAPAQSIDLPVLIHRIHFGDSGADEAAAGPCSSHRL